MKYWTPRHETLLNALQANAVVPVMYRRLSLERFSPDDAEIRRLRDWPASLRDDPGWEVIEPVLNRPAAWPRVWDDAVQAGFSGRTDHHHALLFGRFCQRFVTAGDWESARWAWRQCVGAWSRVFTSDYPGELFDDLSPDLTDTGPDRDEMLASMLDGLVDRRVEDLRRASGLARPADIPAIESRRLRFAANALEVVASQAPSGERADPFGTLARLARRAIEGRASVNAEVLSRFEKLADQVDFSESSSDALLGHFRWVRSYFDVMGQTEASATTVITRLVDACWALRRMDRDDLTEFTTLLELGEPFNEELFSRLKEFDSAFGHNSRCADYLVFIGEKETDAERRKEVFGSSLAICPGHRNSAMLLSYEYLNEARKILTQTALAPGVAAVVPGTSRRLGELVTEAWELVERAEETYPYNESLPEVREELEKEATRLNVRLSDAERDG